MIQSYMDETTGAALFRVRVFCKSSKNQLIRVTRQKGGFKSELEAGREEVKLKRECEREVLEQESRGVLFCDLLDQWYEHEMKMRVLTQKKQKLTLDDSLGYLKKWFGDYLRRPATDLNPYALVSVFETMKRQGICVGHQKKIKQALKNAFDLGIQSGLLPTLTRSPTFDVVLKRDEEKAPEILTSSQIEKLLGKAYSDDHPWRRVWAAALLTGMRSGEMYALTWKDVEWENRQIAVSKSYNARMRLAKCTKGRCWRHVPISQALEKVLRDQFTETGPAPEAHVFPRRWEWDRGLQAKVLRRFCYLHGLPSIKFHTLRACFATQLLQAGVEAAKVMKICGWKELKTMQHYVRLAGIEIQGATDSLEFAVPAPRTDNLLPAPLDAAPVAIDQTAGTVLPFFRPA